MNKEGKKMKSRKIFKDGIEEDVVGPIKIHHTSDGHTVEAYKLTNGKRRFFATIADSHWCAHGDSVASAVADALWKDPSKRPSMESLVASINAYGKKRKITLGEFRILTGACLTGCRDALARVKRDESPLTAYEIRDIVNREWGNKLLSVLKWD